MVRITHLEAENIKRVRAVELEPSSRGLTVIGGRNGQGKTSVLDAIIWGLGGDKYRPSKPQHEGSVLPPHIRIELSNGIVAERKGKNSALQVTDPSGRRAGQQLLNEFVEAFALNLPLFLQAGSREKAQTLLRIIGVGDKLIELDRQEDELYQQRLTIGRIGEQKRMYAEELPHYDDVPEDVVSASELIRRQQAILLRNEQNRRLRERVDELARLVADLTAQLEDTQKRLSDAQEKLQLARNTAQGLEDQSTEALERDIEAVDAINAKVRSNLERERAREEAQEYASQYAGLTARIEEVRKARQALLDGAQMPLEGLSVERGELTYNGAQWDCMSGAEQLRVATAIVRRLNPKCGFVLLDKLEQMDGQTLREFGAWLEQEGLQAIATRVSTGDECSIIIEDGRVLGQPAVREPVAVQEPAEQPRHMDWKGGF